MKRGMILVFAATLCVVVMTAENAEAQTGNARLNGRYAFSLREAGDPPVAVGTFVADGNGNITSGTIDYNRGEGSGIVLQNEPFTGSYSIGSDGRGTMTLTSTNLGNAPLRFVITGNNDFGYFQSFDPSNPTVINRGGDGGFFEKADSTAFTATSLMSSGGGYAFQIRGDMTDILTGRLTMGASGQVTGGVLDRNNGGTATNNVAFTGTYTSPDATTGRGQLTFSAFSTTLNFRYYVVNASKLVFVGVDTAVAYLGLPEKQSGTFSNSTLNGTYVLIRAASDNTNAAAIGRFQGNGSGGISSGIMDSVSGGANLSNRAFTGTYSIASNGRGTAMLTDTMSSTSDGYFIYMISASRAFIMEDDAFSGNAGLWFMQTGGPFSNSSLNGTYGFGLEGTNLNSSTLSEDYRRTGVFTANSGTVNFTHDTSDGGILTVAGTSSGTYSVDSAGRGSFDLGGSTDLRFYLVSPSQLVLANLNVSLTLFGTSVMSSTVPAPAPAVSLNPSSLNFGNQNVGTTSAGQDIVLTNTGNAPLTITSITITGTNPGDFMQSHNCPLSPATLAASGTCTITITFGPTAGGPRSATASVASNASGSPHTAALSGTGVVVGPGLSLNPASLNFGNQNVGTTSNAQNILLTNTGNAALTITSITITGTNPGDFAQTNNCPLSPATLAASGTCTIMITFGPTAGGPRSASASIASDAPGSPHAAGLSGTGVVPAPGASLNPPMLTFGNQLVGTTSSGQNITLTNNGTLALTITSISITGTNSGDFAQTNNCPVSPVTLAVSGTCTITVTFGPGAQGAKSASVSVASDAPGSPHTAALSGTGTTPPSVMLSAASLTFSGQVVNTTSSAQTVTLTNNGGSTLTITSIALSGTNAADFTRTDNCGASVNAAASCTITVTFRPAGPGMRSATITITDNASGSPRTITLSGIGTDFSGGAATGSSTSATVTAGQPAMFNLTFTSNGFAGTLTLTCSGAPPMGTCDASPAMLPLTAGGTGNTTINVTTTARTGWIGPRQLPPGLRFWPLVWLTTVLASALLFAFGAWRRTGRLRPAMALMALAVVLLVAPACNNNDSMPTGTPAGTYALTVTATSGGASRTVTLNLTVN